MTVKVKKFGHVYSGEIVKRGVRRALVRFKTKRGVEKQYSLPIVRTEREFDLLCTGCVLIMPLQEHECRECGDEIDEDQEGWLCRSCEADASAEPYEVTAVWENNASNLMRKLAGLD